jgi:hypothetical protein
VLVKRSERICRNPERHFPLVRYPRSFDRNLQSPILGVTKKGPVTRPHHAQGAFTRTVWLGEGWWSRSVCGKVPPEGLGEIHFCDSGAFCLLNLPLWNLLQFTNDFFAQADVEEADEQNRPET